MPSLGRYACPAHGPVGPHAGCIGLICPGAERVNRRPRCRRPTISNSAFVVPCRSAGAGLSNITYSSTCTSGKRP